MAVTKRLRYEILRRDNHTCRYCGATAPDVPLTVDHVTPKALGGSDDPSNLVTACKPCNDGKSSVPSDAPLVADVQQKALEWGAAIQVYNEAQASKREVRDQYTRRFQKAWDKWRFGFKNDPIPLDDGWLSTIWRFHDSGLPIDEVLDAVQIACGNSAIPAAKTWRYFCGIAWKRITAMQDGARELLDRETAEQEEDGVPPALYQRGWADAHDYFAYEDIPTRILSNVVEGTNAKWVRDLRWTA